MLSFTVAIPIPFPLLCCPSGILLVLEWNHYCHPSSTTVPIVRRPSGYTCYRVADKRFLASIVSACGSDQLLTIGTTTVERRMPRFSPYTLSLRYPVVLGMWSLCCPFPCFSPTGSSDIAPPQPSSVITVESIGVAGANPMPTDGSQLVLVSHRPRIGSIP